MSYGQRRIDVLEFLAITAALKADPHKLEAVMGYVMMAALIALFARIFGWFLAPKEPPVE